MLVELSAKCSPFCLPCGPSLNVIYFKPVKALSPLAALVCNCNILIKDTGDILPVLTKLSIVLIICLANILFCTLAASISGISFLYSSFFCLALIGLFNIRPILAITPSLEFIGDTKLKSKLSGKF